MFYCAFMLILSALCLFLRSLILPRLTLAAEILAVRQQLAVLNRSVKRPQLRRQDRFFWVMLSRLWKNWREALIIVKPETVIKWHRQGFRLYWRWKSKAPIGRPKIDKDLRDLIRRLSRENPLWGVPRIQSELRLLGFEVAERTVAKYRIKNAKPPSQTWKTFLANHAKLIVAVDFFTNTP
jgi:putative transposase